MNIYLIKLDNKIYKRYKTYEDSYNDFEKILSELPDSKIEIELEEYCEFGHSESSCKVYSLCKYENGLINKYI